MIQQNRIEIKFKGLNEKIGLYSILDIQLSLQIILMEWAGDNGDEYTTHITTFHIHSTGLCR